MPGENAVTFQRKDSLSEGWLTRSEYVSMLAEEAKLARKMMRSKAESDVVAKFYRNHVARMYRDAIEHPRSARLLLRDRAGSERKYIRQSVRDAVRRFAFLLLKPEEELELHEYSKAKLEKLAKALKPHSYETLMREVYGDACDNWQRGKQ